LLCTRSVVSRTNLGIVGFEANPFQGIAPDFNGGIGSELHRGDIEGGVGYTGQELS
jgi:hypothetical protein